MICCDLEQWRSLNRVPLHQKMWWWLFIELGRNHYHWSSVRKWLQHLLSSYSFIVTTHLCVRYLRSFFAKHDTTVKISHYWALRTWSHRNISVICNQRYPRSCNAAYVVNPWQVSFERGQRLQNFVNFTVGSGKKVFSQSWMICWNRFWDF